MRARDKYVTRSTVRSTYGGGIDKALQVETTVFAKGGRAQVAILLINKGRVSQRFGSSKLKLAVERYEALR